MPKKKTTLEVGYYNSNQLRKFGFKRIGNNVLISKNINIVGASNITIGNNVRIDSHTDIISKSGYLKLGDYIHISSHNFLACYGGIEIGNFTVTAPAVKIFSLTGDYLGQNIPNTTVNIKISKPTHKKIIIEKYSIIGAGTIILPGAYLKEGTAIGANSVINKTTEKWTIYAGSPSKKIKKRSNKFLKKLKKDNYI
tara:strand:- start:1011 stop:1598 length:588 start_codon:yes stop_codon:yes gene_type:complete